jgi:predicted ATPase
MKIAKCHISNFTVFKEQDLEFCKGVNAIIGANATGKSHLLKILYAINEWMADEKEDSSDDDKHIHFLRQLLVGLFKPEDSDFGNLIRSQSEKKYASISITSETGRYSGVDIFADHIWQGHNASPSCNNIPNAKGIFIPPNEVLAMYPGFTASYEKRELAFDQTYYDICKALSAAPLKTKDIVLSRLKLDLEDILRGEVIQKGDRFYVRGKESKRPLEAHLLAEGHRKIAALVQLINNGSIDKDTILFWDEPEANMNPRMIKHIAVLLRELASVGVQVFITTHDYLLTGELSLAAEYQTQPNVPIRFFAMSREGDNPVNVQSGDTLADLHDNPILDEFAEHYQREQDAVIEYTKARNQKG